MTRIDYFILFWFFIMILSITGLNYGKQEDITMGSNGIINCINTFLLFVIVITLINVSNTLNRVIDSYHINEKMINSIKEKILKEEIPPGA